VIRYGVLLLSMLGLSADTVTLDLAQYFDVQNAPVLVFSGTISSRAGGQYVEVLGRECRSRGERLISGVQTSEGGGWRVENPDSRTSPARQTPVHSGMPFRARWHGQYSRPVTWHLPAGPVVARIGRTRTWVVHMRPATPTGQPAGQVGFHGKLIELQRQAGSRWVRVRTARLARKASFRWGAFNYEARFRVPTRGLTLRAHLPEKSAAPCFLPGASATWRS
jgi:hypothetical protein